MIVAPPSVRNSYIGSEQTPLAAGEFGLMVRNEWLMVQIAAASCRIELA